MLGNLLDFISYFHYEKLKKKHGIYMKKIDFEKFPTGHYELKISCDRPVVWFGGFSCPAPENYLEQTNI